MRASHEKVEGNIEMRKIAAIFLTVVHYQVRGKKHVATL